MPSLPILFAPFALLLPLGWHVAGPGADEGFPIDGDTLQQTRAADRSISPLPMSRDAPAWSPIFDGVLPRDAQQVRIERRVILRISPARAAPRHALTATEQTQRNVRIVERDAGKCLESARIGAVADRGDRLLLFMRDRRTIAARLEKGCSPRDFYRGAYMERSEDGRMCVARDRLMSRAGTKCQVAKFTELLVEPAQ